MFVNRREWLRFAGATLVAQQVSAAPPRWRGAQGAHRTPSAEVAVFRRFPRDPRLLLLHSPSSEPSRTELAKLRVAEGEFQYLEARGWKIGDSVFEHIQMIDADVWPGTAQMHGVTRFPWVGCLERGHVVRTRKAGCTPPLNGDTLYRLLTGGPPSAKPLPGRSQQYPLRAGHWYIDGDFDPILETVITHLRSPMHREQIPAAWKIEDWSYEELRSLHDDLHELGLSRELVAVS